MDGQFVQQVDSCFMWFFLVMICLFGFAMFMYGLCSWLEQRRSGKRDED